MFTGIVEEAGVVESITRTKKSIALTVHVGALARGIKLGASVAVNGCCLTVVAMGDGWWEADVSEETLVRTSLRGIRPGSPLNLERSVKLQDRLEENDDVQAVFSNEEMDEAVSDAAHA